MFSNFMQVFGILIHSKCGSFLAHLYNQYIINTNITLVSNLIYSYEVILDREYDPYI